MTRSVGGHGRRGAAEAADSDTTLAADEAAPDTGGEATDASSGVREVLPDACGLIDDATAAAAMGGAADTKQSPQPPTDSSARCEWTTSGCAGRSRCSCARGRVPSPTSATPPRISSPRRTSGAEAAVQLGSKQPDPRLVTFLAYDGQYYVSVTLQGPSLDRLPRQRKPPRAWCKPRLANLQA